LVDKIHGNIRTELKNRLEVTGSESGGIAEEEEMMMGRRKVEIGGGG